MQGIISINYEVKSSLKLEIYMYKTDFMESPLDNWNRLNWRRKARTSFLKMVATCFGTMFFRFGTIVFIVFIIRFIYWILIKFCHQLKF
jgi:hypothetical protein